MSTNTQDTVVEKVRAILDRANHPNTPPAEAETALALAQRLITKYNLDESALAQAQAVDEKIVKDSIIIVGQYALRRISVAGEVARANSCACYRSTYYSKEWTTNKHGRDVRGKDGYTLYLYGTEADIFATKVLWQAVEALALRTIPKGDKSFRHSWWVGFANGIRQALTKATKEAVVEAGGNALVLVERRERAESELRATVKLRSATTKGASRSDAYYSGRTAGASFATNGVGRGAIGALGR